MARRVFYSFHYKPDSWRASQVRNIGVVEGSNRPVTDNEWEEITRGGDGAIERWIDSQLDGKSCAAVLVGEKTAGRKWINYEIKKAWNEEKGVVGIYIHGLKDKEGFQSNKGANPFSAITIGGRTLSTIVKAYDTPYSESKNVYQYISDNLSDWIEKAITIRQSY
jgi:hypothetical protein